MFDTLKGMSAIAGIMKDLPRLKAKMEDVKARLGTVQVEAATGGGAVTATANARLEIVAVRVDPALLAGLVDPDRPDDRVLAEELIAGAVNAALAKARDVAEREMRSAAGEMGIAIPSGLDGLLR